MGICWTPWLPRRGLLALALVLATAMGGTTVAAQDLPPAIEADRLLLLAEQQLRDEDFGAALIALDQILELQAQHNLELPAPFWFSHAHVAMQAGFPEVARASALRYLEVTGQGGEHYVEALELLNEAEAARVEGEAMRVADSMAAIAAAREDSIRAAERRPGRVFRDCGECPEMVVVPAGSFTMGSPETEEDRWDDEGPQHQVTIAYPLAVGVYEVTFAEWETCVRAGGCGHYVPEDEDWGRGNRPVINVSWWDARAYVAWLSSATGERYRLLSEAEWEYVARAGTETARYWGDSELAQCDYSNGFDRDGRSGYSNPRARCYDGYGNTAAVGSFRANAFGLYDVLGNVLEWTQDCWNESYAGAPIDGTAWRSGDCSRRLVRGGSWFLNPGYLRSAYRGGSLAGGRSGSLGFRVARTIN